MQTKRRKLVRSWLSAYCCFHHEETAWAKELCLSVQNVCPERSRLQMGYVCTVDLKAFAGPLELQYSESPRGAAFQRLLLIREGSWQWVFCHLRDNWARKGRLEINRFSLLHLWRQKLSKHSTISFCAWEGDKWHPWKSGVESFCYQRQWTETLSIGPLPAHRIFCRMFSSQGLNVK